MARVLVTEKIAQSGLDLLAKAGHEVSVQEGLSPEELLVAIVGAQALIIRSSTQVTADVLDAGSSLEVVGRAGVGLDNVDVTAATQRGVMVVNAPTSNILSVAEQAMALLLAQARNIPQAHAVVGGGALGALEVGGRRAPRQGSGRGRAGAGGLSGGPACPRLRHGADRLRPLRLGGAGQGHGDPAWWVSKSWWARRTSSPSTRPRRPRRSASSGATCWPRPSRVSGSSTRPAVASWTKRRWPRPFATASWPGPGSTSSPRSRAPNPPCSPCRRWWCPRTSGRRPRRPRTKPE